MTAQDAGARRRIDRYTPDCLSEREWSRAADSVRAAVTAAAPVDAEDAKGLLSRLCLFLAGPCGWDRNGAPQIPSVVTEPAIAAHLERLAAAGKSGKTRENHRADLRRIARAAAGLPPRARRARAARAARRPTEPAACSPLASAVAQPLPLVAVATAWAKHRGCGLSRAHLDPVVQALAGGLAATATTQATGTLILAHTPDAPLEVVITAPSTSPTAVHNPTSNTASTSAAKSPVAAKPLSRAAALRHAKAAAAAVEQAAAGPVLAPEPDPASLPEAVRRAIADYRPQDVTPGTWEPVAALTRRLVVGYRPTSGNNARNVATHTFGLLRWAATRPGRADRKVPLDPAELLTPGLLDSYLTHLAAQHTPDATLASIRSALRRVLRALDGVAQPPKIAYQPVAAPYDPSSCAHLVRLARHQPTPDRRRSLSFVVGLALGAGLDGRDLRHVSRDEFADLHPAEHAALDLAEVGPDHPEAAPYLTVTVAGGERPRTVVVRRAYEPLVREALALHDQARRGKRAPILGRSSTRRNITTPVMESAVTAQADVTVDIEVNRLRATWLVAAMTAAIPLADLLAAAGLRSARTLTDLLPYCATPEAAQVTAALAALTDHQALPPATPGQSATPPGQVRS